AADFRGRLLFEIKPDQDFAIPPRNAAQKPQRQLFVLPLNDSAFRVARMIAESYLAVQSVHGVPGPDGLFDLRGDMTAYHGTDIAHQAFGFAHVSAADRLRDQEEDFMDPVIQVLRAELAI